MAETITNTTSEESLDEKTINEIIGKLDAIPSADPDSRAYENQVTKIANTYNAAILVKACQPILADPTKPLDLRYKCFYALSVQYRTVLDYKGFDDMLQSYSAEFQCYASLSHLQLMQGLEQIKNGYFEGTFLELRELLDRGLENCDTLSRNVGAMHAYCDLEASIYEYLLLLDWTDKLDLTLYFEKAMTCILKCIRMEQYPKFYSTQARLHIQAKEYTKAYKCISIAIAKEPIPKSGDDFGKYNMKILSYNMIKNSITNTKTTAYIDGRAAELSEKTSDFDTEISDFNNRLTTANSEFSQKLEESSTKSIEIIGFFLWYHQLFHLQHPNCHQYDRP